MLSEPRKKDKLYSVAAEPEEDIWRGYDPNKARAGLRKSAGAFWGVDREELLVDIHAARGQDSQGWPA